MSVRLRVGYLNVQGLTQDKADVLSALVGPDNDYDILFLAETWHISLRPNPLTLISSPPPSSPNLVGRQHGGLTVLISPNLRALVTGVAAPSPYLLDISLPGLLVRGVYVPPSLSAYQLKMILDVSFSGHLLIVGDINTRFGATFGDSTSGPRDKMDEVEFLCQKWSLTHLRSSSGLTRVDHAFASHPLRAT